MKKLLFSLMCLAGVAMADTGDIPLSSNFQVNSPRALDARTTVADATARNAIAAINRYDGLTVYQRSDSTMWQLQGGTTTWVNVSSSGGSGGSSVYPATATVSFPSGLYYTGDPSSYTVVGTSVPTTFMHPAVFGSSTGTLLDVGSVLGINGPTTANYFKISMTDSLVTFRYFNSGVSDNTFTWGSPPIGMNINTTLAVSGSANTVRANAALLSVASGAGTLTDEGILDLWSVAGKPSYVSFNEQGVANRGTLGFPAGSGDLILYTGSETFGSGTERLRVSPTGGLIAKTSATVQGAGGLGVTYNVTAGSLTLGNVASGTQCLHADSTGKVTGTGSDCGTGGGAATLPLPGGATNYWNYPSSGTFVAGYGMSGSTLALSGALNVGPTATGIGAQSRLSFDPANTNPQLNMYVNNFIGSGGAINWLNYSGSTLVTVQAATVSNGIGLSFQASSTSVSSPVNRWEANPGFQSFDSPDGTQVMKIYTSSVSVLGATGLNTTYGVVAGSLTLGNVASGTQCLHADSSGIVTGTGSDCSSGGGGGGSSTLETLFGTARSSPTATLKGSSDFLGSVTSSTMTISMNPLNSGITTFGSSVTVTNTSGLSTTLLSVSSMTTVSTMTVTGRVIFKDASYLESTTTLTNFAPGGAGDIPYNDGSNVLTSAGLYGFFVDTTTHKVGISASPADYRLTVGGGVWGNQGVFVGGNAFPALIIGSTPTVTLPTFTGTPGEALVNLLNATQVLAQTQLKTVGDVQFNASASPTSSPGGTFSFLYNDSGSAGLMISNHANAYTVLPTQIGTHTWTGQNTFSRGISASTLTLTGLTGLSCLGTDGSGNVQSGTCSGGGGGSGYAVQPATVTFQLTQGATVSILLVTSSATIQSLTEGTSTFATQTTSGTIIPNAYLANTFIIPLASTVTINGPINPRDTQAITFRIQQDAVTRTVTWATGAGNFSYGSDIPAINLSNGGSKYDYVKVIYNAAANRWNVVSVIRGF